MQPRRARTASLASSSNAGYLAHRDVTGQAGRARTPDPQDQHAPCTPHACTYKPSCAYSVLSPKRAPAARQQASARPGWVLRKPFTAAFSASPSAITCWLARTKALRMPKLPRRAISGALMRPQARSSSQIECSDARRHDHIRAPALPRFGIQLLLPSGPSPFLPYCSIPPFPPAALESLRLPKLTCSSPICRCENTKASG